ncbi:cucurbitadienol 11-hydroxylase-like, partial [Fagus crenata]
MLEDHKKALNVMRDVLNKRLSSPDETHQGDVLDHLIKDMKVENFLTKEFAVQLRFGLLFVTFDSLSATLTLAFKLLAENPTVLEELTVINETLRLGSVTPGLIQRARKDIQVN